MSKILIILTLLGCDDGVTRCDVLPVPEPTYVTEAECQAAADVLLESGSDVPYPTLVTQCGTVDATMEFLHSVAPPDQVAAFRQRIQQQASLN